MRLVQIPPETRKRNNLTALGPAFSVQNRLWVVVECGCGACKVVNFYNWKRGVVKSCGCLSRKLASERMRIRNTSRTTSAAHTHRLYRVYNAMKDRCRNPRCKQYADYGGRGIKVCDRWLGKHGFSNFLVDMEATFQEGLTLDRTDNDGPYSPENCQWVDRFVQNSHTRKTVTLTHDGKTLTLSQWSRELGIGRDVLCRRRKRGLTTEEILAPVQPNPSRGPDGRWLSRAT